ncbi:hypothetical protein FRC17_003348 [Serendipita sp. 399]|nr:hypothetical protein FRC17_003348 [Serendipita sp. 399]
MNELVTITVDDSSPLLRYTPNPVFNPNVFPDPYTNWSPLCAVQGSEAGGSRCDDHSAHSTGLNGARLAISFYGVAVEFYGNVTLGLNVQVTLDGTVIEPTPDYTGAINNRTGIVLGGANPARNLLMALSGFPIGQHTVVFTVQAGADRSLLMFDKLRLIIGHATSFTRTIIDGTDEQALTYGPPNQHLWSTWDYTYQGIVVPAGASNTSFRASDKREATIYKKFTGSAYLYYGPCYTTTGAYTLLLDGTANTQPIEYNSSVPYQQAVQACLRGYAGGLSKSASHELLITNNEDQKWLTMSWLEVWQLDLLQEQAQGGGGGGGGGSGNGAMGHTTNFLLSLFASSTSPLLSTTAMRTMTTTTITMSTVGRETSSMSSMTTAIGSLMLYTLLFRAAFSIFQ